MTAYYVRSRRGSVYHDGSPNKVAPCGAEPWRVSRGPRGPIWRGGSRPPRNRRLCLRCEKLRLAHRPCGGEGGDDS
jgi:hypothetical protein